MEITDDGFEEPQYQQLWQPERQDPYLSLFIRGALKVTTNLTLLWSLSRLLFRILSRLLWIWSLLAMATGLSLSLSLSLPSSRILTQVWIMLCRSDACPGAQPVVVITALEACGD